jgi:ERCC4-type nuclease
MTTNPTPITNLILEIDYRESCIIKLLNPKLQIKVSDTIYKTGDLLYKICNLDVGDFIFKRENQVYYIIERKTFKDLCSSIKDNRMNEQRERLKQSNCEIIYILEGNKNVPKIYNIPVSTINSAIQNLIFKHCFAVITSENETDTICNLNLLYKKLQDNTFSTPTTPNIIKKADTINKNVFVNQLAVIPGVSLNIAQKIKEQYSCMNDLVVKFVENELLLSEIQITEKRKLGKNLSKKIHDSLFKL